MTNKDGVRSLWEEVFSDDSKEFTDMYFNRVYQDENAFVKKVDDTIVSAVQLIPYYMTHYGSVIKTGYISGASTLQRYEGEGLMTSLMAEAINSAYDRGDVLMTLIPANDGMIGFYRRFGFIPVFRKSESVFNYSGNCINNYIVKIDNNNSDRFYGYFNRKMRQRQNCLQHTYDDFINICIDSDMMVFALEENETIISMAFCIKTERDLLVNELLSDNRLSIEVLLNNICMIFDLPQIIYRDYYTTLQGYEYGMGRVINVFRILTIFASNNKNLNLVLKVTDDIIEANNSFYVISGGVVEMVREYRRDDYNTMKSEDIMLYIKTYNTNFSSNDPFYMSLMLE